MTQRASLFAFNPERHRDVRLIPGVDLAGPLLTHHAEIGLDEVAAAAADYPLLFLKDGETGRLRLVTLFGLAPGQNSYVVMISGRQSIYRWRLLWHPFALLVRTVFCASTRPIPG